MAYSLGDGKEGFFRCIPGIFFFTKILVDVSFSAQPDSAEGEDTEYEK